MPATVEVGAIMFVPMVSQEPPPPPITLKAPPLIVKPVPVISVIAESDPTIKLSMTVVVALTTVALKSLKLAKLSNIEVVATVRP